jgi:membrane-bound lytic murein transglycosylase B
MSSAVVLSVALVASAALPAAAASLPAAAAAGSGPTTTAPPQGTVTTATSPTSTTPASTTPATSTTSTTTSTTITVGPPTPPPVATPATVPPANAPVGSLQIDQVDNQFLTSVQAEVGASNESFDNAIAAESDDQAVDARAAAALAVVAQRVADLDAAQHRAAVAIVTATDRLKDVAVASYESGGPGSPVAALLSSETIGDFARRQAYFGDVNQSDLDAVRGYKVARDSAARATIGALGALQKAQLAKRAADQQLASATLAAEQSAAALAGRKELLTLTTDAVSAPSTDVPRLFLDAYQRAAATVQGEGCHLSWWGLAGIGRVESDHGRAEHAHLEPDGDLVPHIVGVPLTGQNGTALVVDSDGAYAQAEGPMQFIPSTWAEWGRDGNGNGIADPNNIYDSSLAAADYLCASSLDLETDQGLETAYFSYNHSADYVAEVLAYAHSYEAADIGGLIPPMAPVPLYTLAPPAGPGPPTSATADASG